MGLHDWMICLGEAKQMTRLEWRKPYHKGEELDQGETRYDGKVSYGEISREEQTGRLHEKRAKDAA